MSANAAKEAISDSLPPQPTDTQPLFRPEAVEAQRTQWLGSVMLDPKPRQSLFVVLALLACTAVLLLLIFGTYTDKVRVRGWLVPDLGLARVTAPHAGVVDRVYVREGASVAQGAPLLTLSAELRTQNIGGSREEIVRQLTARKSSLTEAKARAKSLAEQQLADLKRRLSLLEGEVSHMEREISLQRSRVQIVQQTVERERRMRARDLISLTRLQRTEQESLDAAARLEAAERARQALLREQALVSAQIAELPGRTELQLNEYDRNISSLEQELADAEAKRELVLVAPLDGAVTGLQAEPGSSAQSGTVLLSVIPAGSTLVAQMFASSRGAGFLRPGQLVRLRYRAYPYQKFGFQEGRVASVSRAAVSPSELPSQFAGLTSLLPPNEPVYRVSVELKNQFVPAHDERMALQPGMEVEADILVETRRLIEWVLEPVFSVTGRRAQ